jgi:hypothetical protein
MNGTGEFPCMVDILLENLNVASQTSNREAVHKEGSTNDRV